MRIPGITMRLLWILLLLSGGMRPETCFSLTLSIANRAYPGGNPAAFNTLADAIETQFNSVIASGPNQAEFLTQVGNANAMSSRGFIAPGAMSGSSKFYVSAAASGAVAVAEGARFTSNLNLSENRLPAIGLSAKAGISMGVSGARVPRILPLDPARTTYSASYFSTDDFPFSGSRYTLKSSQASVGMSYQLDLPKPLGPLIRFNGFKFTTGLSYSVFEASYEIPFSLSSSSGANTVTWSDDVSLGLTSRVLSFSNEVVTGVRAFWFATLYTGVGMDLNVGSTSFRGSSSGQVTGTGAGGVTQFTGSASINGQEISRAPTWVQFRYLVGTQLDLGPFGLFVQGQVATPAVYGLNIGAHFAL
jgi:hypothetical protein